MILGLGNDIIEIVRIKKMIDRFGQHLLDRLFTKDEQLYCQKYRDPAIHFAGRFAAKEAVVKAFGTGFSKEIGWLDFEILSGEKKKPYLLFSEKLSKKMEGSEMHISISHCKEYASAVAIWSKKRMDT